MNDEKVYRRIIPAVLRLTVEDENVARGVIIGINQTLDLLQHNGNDVFLRVPPTIEAEYPPEQNDWPQEDKYKVCKIYARFNVASAINPYQGGRRIITNKNFYEEPLTEQFDILNNKVRK